MLRCGRVPGVLALLCVAGALLTSMAASAGQRFVATDLWVKDAKTGLWWSRHGNPAGTPLSWDDAVKFVGSLNMERYAGHADWRLPELNELKSFIVAVKEAGGVDSFSGNTTVDSVLTRLGFHDVQARDYWSSTMSIYNSTEAWCTSMMYGGSAARSISLYMYVWPVRWERPTGRK